MTKKVLFGLITITLVALVAVPLCSSSCVPTLAPAKVAITIGGSRPLSGMNAIYEQTAFGPVYKMWIDEVNAKGGIYVEDYGKRLPIAEPIIYDDTSDLGTMTRQLERLMTVDKVDFCLPPASTAFLFGAAPIFNKHEYILLGAEGGATTITDMLPGLPYFFGVLNYSDRYQLPVLADIFVEVGVESVAIIFLQDLHGVEYSGVATTELDKRGIDVVMVKSVPPDIKDASPLLLEAQSRGADALCIFAYPPQNFLAVGQAMAMGINFDAVLLGPGGCFGAFPASFSNEIVDGVMFEGAWNCKSSPQAQEFCDKFIPLYGEVTVDWWGHLLYYGGLQFFEQAIEEAGTLDQSVIREVMATSTFETCLGPTWFDQFGDSGGCLLAIECHPGEIGQWQNGVAEVIDPGANRTAPPIYPKPDWPAPPPE